MVQVYCKNTKTSKKFPEGTSLVQMLAEFEFERPYPIVSAIMRKSVTSCTVS